MNSNLGLVLMSGGARGAYQAGALRAIEEITKVKELPFPYLSGISAGSLNCAYLGCNAENFDDAISKMTHIWYNMKPADIFDTSHIELVGNGINWIKDFTIGGFVNNVKGRSLLNTKPLYKLLNHNLNFEQLSKNITDEKIKGIAITATNYYTGTSVVFYDGKKDIKPWSRDNKISIRTKIESHHLMASSAIPFFFPAIKINDSYYGDGCIRMNTPLSPVINMGAEKIIAIGVRHEKKIKTERDLKIPYFIKYPLFAELGGVIFNALFLDALEADIEHAKSKNIIYLLASKNSEIVFGIKNIPTLLLRPSLNLEDLVRKASYHFPFLIKHFLKGMGASGEIGWNIMSYLAFDASYTSRLVELGYEDTLLLKEKILDFMEI